MELSLLPRVREGTYESVVKSIEDEYNTDGDFIIRFLEHLKEVNPEICFFILKWIDSFKGIKYARAILGMCFMYRLLESEAEAKQFEKEMEN